MKSGAALFGLAKSIYYLDIPFLTSQVKSVSVPSLLLGRVQAVHKALRTSVMLMPIARVDGCPCAVKIVVTNDTALLK